MLGMKRGTLGVVMIAASGLLAACTQLQVNRNPGGTIVGVPYSLPKKTFVVSVEYALQECTFDAAANPPILTVVVGKTVSVVPAIEPDESEKYVVPYSAIHNWLKETDFTVENYDNQTIKSVNSAVTDRTGETITAVLGTTLRIASLAGGVKLLARDAGKAAATRETFCGAQGIRALNDADRIQTAIAGKKPIPGVADPAAALEAVKSQLKYKQVEYWTPSKPDSGKKWRYVLDIYPSDLVDSQRWITKAGIAFLNESKRTNSSKLSELETQVTLDLSEPSIGDGGNSLSTQGFVFRLPIMGLLRVCDVSCPTGRSGDANNVLLTGEHAVPQLGQYVVVPLESRPFENQTLVINTSADGVITKVGVKTNAAALAAANSINADLDAIEKAKDARDKAKADAAQSAQSKTKNDAQAIKDTNNAIAECLKAQAAVVTAGGVPTGICQ
jgi:hypothetical protein